MTLLPVPATPTAATLTSSPLGVEQGTRYEIVGPDGTIAVLNDSSSPDFVGYVTELTGIDSAEVREAVDLRAGADGAIHGDFYLGRRVIVFSGLVAEATTVTGTTELQQRASILEQRNARISRLQRATNALRGDAVLRWQTTGGDVVEIAVRRNDPLRISDRVPKRFQIGLAAADPRIYSRSVTSLAVGGGAGTTRKQDASLVADPRVRTGWDAQLIIKTLGSTSTPPIIAIAGPANSWEVYNATTNKSVKAATGSTPNIGSGSTLVLDYATAGATLVTGSTRTDWYSRVDFVNTSWDFLAPGTNDLRLFASGTSSGTTSYRVEWRDAWA